MTTANREQLADDIQALMSESVPPQEAVARVFGAGLAAILDLADNTRRIADALEHMQEFGVKDR